MPVNVHSRGSRIINLQFLKLNFWPYCVAISRDIAKHCNNSFLVHLEGSESLYFEINFPFELDASPSDNHLPKVSIYNNSPTL